MRFIDSVVLFLSASTAIVGAVYLLIALFTMISNFLVSDDAAYLFKGFGFIIVALVGAAVYEELKRRRGE